VQGAKSPSDHPYLLPPPQSTPLRRLGPFATPVSTVSTVGNGALTLLTERSIVRSVSVLTKNVSSFTDGQLSVHNPGRGWKPGGAQAADVGRRRVGRGQGGYADGGGAGHLLTGQGIASEERLERSASGEECVWRASCESGVTRVNQLALFEIGSRKRARRCAMDIGALAQCGSEASKGRAWAAGKFELRIEFATASRNGPKHCVKCVPWCSLVGSEGDGFESPRRLSCCAKAIGSYGKAGVVSS
jgi:hypothetical protein